LPIGRKEKDHFGQFKFWLHYSHPKVVILKGELPPPSSFPFVEGGYLHLSQNAKVKLWWGYVESFNPLVPEWQVQCFGDASWPPWTGGGLFWQISFSSFFTVQNIYVIPNVNPHFMPLSIKLNNKLIKFNTE
jgi:hypothetical protein